jgi:hypothetical protein
VVMNNFKGAAKPLDRFDIPELAHRIDVSEDHLQAFLNVESRSTGFDRAGRPVILTEPHVFYRNLSGAKRDAAVAAGLAYPKWGTKPYPKTSDARYAWLEAASKIDLEAALMACSWGSTQVLGENAKMVGYSSAKAMVQAFMDDEENHVEAMVNFILASGIADDLKAERWSVVARVYNGPGYKKNKYDTKMAQEFAKLRGVADVVWSPGVAAAPAMQLTEEVLKPIQRRLGDLGYKEVGWADGKWGTKTRAAVLAFRADHGLPLVPQIDKDFTAALMTSAGREISEDRLETTSAGLREAGSRSIIAADKGVAAGGVVAVTGAVAAAKETLDGVTAQIGGLQGVTDAVTGLVGSLEGVWPWALIGLGAYVIYQQFIVKKARVDDHRSGKNPYPGGS